MFQEPISSCNFAYWDGLFHKHSEENELKQLFVIMDKYVVPNRNDYSIMGVWFDIHFAEHIWNFSFINFKYLRDFTMGYICFKDGIIKNKPPSKWHT